jgi:hypothetical protein
MDESYNSKMFTLSILLSPPHEWMWIESRWKKVLRQKNKELRNAGRPEIPRYHATDCSNLKREFKGWTVDEQINFVKRLLRALSKNMTMMEAYSVPVDDYVAVFPEHANNPLPQIYGILMSFLMTQMNHDIGKKAKRSVNISLFHDRSSYDSIILGAFNRMMADPTFDGQHLFSSVTSIGWEDCIPLQAADLVAYEAFKDSAGRLAGKDRRKALASLLDAENFGGRSKMFNRNALEKLRKALEENQALKSLTQSGEGGA